MKHLLSSPLKTMQFAVSGSFAFFFFLIFVNNILDYEANFQFVKHVLSMDTIFPDSPLSWRKIVDPATHHFFYFVIIAIEALMTFVALRGFFFMYFSKSFSKGKIWIQWSLVL